MSAIVLQPTVTAQWQALVSDAEQACSLHLTEDLESYLVFLLVRFSQHPELATSVVALEFLQSFHEDFKRSQEILRDVGDQCLLLSGLYPGHAVKRNVRISYYVDIGQAAYGALSALNKQSLGQLFHLLEKHFVMLMDVLQTMRELSGKINSLLPLQAAELWADTRSQYALKILRQYSKASSVFVADKSQSGNKH